MEPSPALACYIRGCPNEFGMVDPKQLLYVCTADDIQCKAWLTAIPKVSLKDVDDKLCLCSLHFENGVNVGGDSLPTIFPPLPGTSEIITDDPLPPAPVVPPIRIKEEPVDDYEQTGPQSSELESSVNLDSLPAWEDEESSMEVDHVAGASAARRNSFIPPHKIKREIDDSNEAGTSSSTQDSTSVDDGSHFLQFVTSYVVKDEPHEDNAEVAAPPPGSGCGVVEIVQRSSAFEIQEEFGEILVENIKTEEEDPAESPTVPPPASLPSAPAVTIKTEPLDPDEVVTNGFGEPSTSHDQGCQADPSSTVLMPPGFISEPPAPSSVASGPTAFVAGNVGALTGDTGFVISEVYSVAGGQQECAEDKAHCPRCVNNEGKQVRDKSTCTNLPTRTVWTQTVEPDKRTVWTQVAQLGDLRMLTHRATQTDPWLERSPRLPKVTRRKRRYEDDDDPDKL